MPSWAKLLSFAYVSQVALDRKVDAILADGASLESFEGAKHMKRPMLLFSPSSSGSCKPPC